VSRSRVTKKRVKPGGRVGPRAIGEVNPRCQKKNKKRQEQLEVMSPYRKTLGSKRKKKPCQRNEENKRREGGVTRRKGTELMRGEKGFAKMGGVSN